VTMKDFLITHDLMPEEVTYTSAALTLLPMSADQNLEALKIAQDIRATGLSCSIDNSDRKIGKKINAAAEAKVIYSITIGSDEVASGNYTMKHLESGNEVSGTIEQLMTHLIELS